MGMYNLKNIMLGFGLGLVLTSLININIQNKNVTIDFIKSEAQKKGLIIIDPKDIINKNIDIPIDNDNVNHSKDDSIVVEVKIEKGFDSYKTADVLYYNGLIEDKKGFIECLSDCRKTDLIQYGVFSIKKGSSIEEIIDIITHPNNITNWFGIIWLITGNYINGQITWLNNFI